MSIIDWVSGAALLLGSAFFCAGTVGLLRFPDVYTRLHALTKADNMGFAFIALGLAWRAESWWEVSKLLLVWGLVILAGTTCCHLVAQVALRAGISPWTSLDDPLPTNDGGRPDA
jgi:multicomponent Na+:H+ antiporter subunit G